MPKFMSDIVRIMPKIEDLLQDGKHFAERVGTDLHIINSLTGEATVIMPPPTNTTTIKYVERRLPSGNSCWVYDNGVQVEEVRQNTVYNPAVVDLICQRIVDGMSLTDVCKLPGMPSYAVLCRWKRQEAWIEGALDQARRDRAEALRDQAVEEAMAADEDNAVPQRLKVDTLKWAAGTDHERYNPKSKVDMTVTAPTQIIVQTGVDRTPIEKDVTPAIEDKND